MNFITKKKFTFTNWTTTVDGEIVQSPVKVQRGGVVRGLYEVEVSYDFIGIVLETDFTGRYIVVRSIDQSIRSISRYAYI
jgi:hypothetical protein